MYPARVGRFAGIAKVAIRVPTGEIGRSVQPLNRKARNGGELRLALGIFIQSGAQRTVFPGFLFGGGFAVRGSWLCVSYGLCRFLGMITHSAPVSCGRYFYAMRKIAAEQARGTVDARSSQCICV